MGTNYYYYDKPTCPHCGRDYERVHIGKSSAGWVFSLHVGRSWENVPKSLAEWDFLFCLNDALIKDEDGTVISRDRMMEIITERKPWGDHELLRHEIDGQHCVGQGDGTYDLIVGEFS